MMPAKRMNLKEIAQKMGVSQSTVSIVLNDRRGVSLSTKQRIAPVLEANGYVIRHKGAGSDDLPPRVMFIKFKQHALMVDGNYEYTAQLIDEVEKWCNKAGYELVFKVANTDTLADVFERANNESFVGIILLGTEFSNDERPLLNNVRKPIIIIDNDLVKLPVTSVSTHTWNSMRRKVEFLLSKGHRSIGYLRNTCPTSICNECFRGFKNAMAEHNLPVLEKYIFDIDPTFDGAYESMRRILNKGADLPTALVSNSDCLALGAMKAMQEFGIRIPENVSLIGGDNITSCTLYSPKLTTCDAHPCEAGKWAVKLLQERIENPTEPVVRLRIETTIIERESVCEFSRTIPYQAQKQMDC